MHVTPEWQDASGGFRMVDIALADHPLHTGGSGRGVEVRLRRTAIRPNASDTGEYLLVKPQPLRLMLADSSQRVWLKSPRLGTQVDLALAYGDPQSSGLAVTDALALADGGLIYRRLGDHFADQLYLEDFGAFGDGTTDDKAAITAAFASGRPLSGAGLTYAVRGSLTLPAGLTLQDATFRQLTPAAASTRTLYASGAPGITLRRITVDRNGAPTDGTIADWAGIWLDSCDDLHLEDVEVFGNGKGMLLRVISSDRVRIIRPYLHDARWAEPLPAGVPTQEQLVGIQLALCSDVIMEGHRCFNLDSLNQWRTGEVIPTLGVQRRYYGANGYQWSSGTTCGATPPTHVSGTVSDGGVSWTWRGNAESAGRAYQTDGIGITGCTNVQIIGGHSKYVGEGIDISGSAVNRNIKVIGMIAEDCDSFGFKLVHRANDSGFIGCHAVRSNTAGFTITGGATSDTDGPRGCYWQDCVAEDTGASGLWETNLNAGFNFASSDIPPVNTLLLNCVSVDRQTVPTMDYGLYDEPASPAKLRVINFQSIGHKTAARTSTAAGYSEWLTDGTLKHTGPITATTTLTGLNVASQNSITVGTALKMQRQGLTLVNGANNNIPIGYTVNTVGGPTGAFTISGFVAIADMYLIILNRTNQDMTIANQKTSSAANQILTMSGADLTLTGNSSATFYYDTGLNLWLLVGYAP